MLLIMLDFNLPLVSSISHQLGFGFCFLFLLVADYFGKLQ